MFYGFEIFIEQKSLRRCIFTKTFVQDPYESLFVMIFWFNFFY